MVTHDILLNNILSWVFCRIGHHFHFHRPFIFSLEILIIRCISSPTSLSFTPPATHCLSNSGQWQLSSPLTGHTISGWFHQLHDFSCPPNACGSHASVSPDLTVLICSISYISDYPSSLENLCSQLGVQVIFPVVLTCHEVSLWYVLLSDPERGFDWMLSSPWFIRSLSHISLWKWTKGKRKVDFKVMSRRFAVSRI